MELRNMTHPNLVLFDVDAQNKEQVIKQLISKIKSKII